jgi:hypothetical protein
MTRKAPGHESHDAPPWIGVLGFGVIAGCVATALALVALLLIAFNAAAPRQAVRSAPPRQGPDLETSPGQALAAVRARAAAGTSAYGWTDPAHRTARIPIARAMQITAQRGWSDASSGGQP